MLDNKQAASAESNGMQEKTARPKKVTRPQGRSAHYVCIICDTFIPYIRFTGLHLEELVQESWVN